MRTNLKNYWLRYGNFIEPVELADQWLAYLHKHAKLKGSLLYQRGPRRSLQQYKKSLVDVPAQAARMWHLQFVSGFLRRNQQIPNLLVVNPWAKKNAWPTGPTTFTNQGGPSSPEVASPGRRWSPQIRSWNFCRPGSGWKCPAWREVPWALGIWPGEIQVDLYETEPGAKYALTI